ncbi:hypothetical protein Goari_000342 [Gossypium aridum]|uniref:Uncharacterized protein n=1 Tax=Gossypium aridum TaxID=34290 RepID=A0A7J8YH10_GOSAI|nr:hypothetical protein [Gossypium aridum]
MCFPSCTKTCKWCSTLFGYRGIKKR